MTANDRGCQLRSELFGSCHLAADDRTDMRLVNTHDVIITTMALVLIHRPLLHIQTGDDIKVSQLPLIQSGR